MRLHCALLLFSCAQLLVCAATAVRVSCRCWPQCSAASISSIRLLLSCSWVQCKAVSCRVVLSLQQQLWHWQLQYNVVQHGPGLRLPASAAACSGGKGGLACGVGLSASGGCKPRMSFFLCSCCPSWALCSGEKCRLRCKRVFALLQACSSEPATQLALLAALELSPVVWLLAVACNTVAVGVGHTSNGAVHRLAGSLRACQGRHYACTGVYDMGCEAAQQRCTFQGCVWCRLSR